MNQSKVIAWHDTKEYVTALSYNKPVLVAGLVSGDIVVYSCEDYLKKKIKINCKNRTGVYAKGRKVTGIEFYDETVVCVTTNDSRIRFVNTQTGELLLKLKGHKNLDYLIRAVLSSDNKFLLSASEDGNCYIWSNIHARI